MGGERGSGKSVLAERHDDDDDDTVLFHLNSWNLFMRCLSFPFNSMLFLIYFNLQIFHISNTSLNKSWALLIKQLLGKIRLYS